MTIDYPAVFTSMGVSGYMVFVPDLSINTSGKDLADAILMARDAIGVTGLDMEDDGTPFPAPSRDVPHKADEIVSLVDVDLAAYRRSLEKKTVRRNVSLPQWLNTAADEAGLNVSAVLQNALKQQLGVQ